MMPKRSFKITVDCIMIFLLPLLMAYIRIGESVHEYLGIAMFIVFIVHIGLNRTWFRNLFRGSYRLFRIFQTGVNFLLVVTIIGLMLSGIFLSRSVFVRLTIHNGQAIARVVHMLLAYWGFPVLSMHLGLHWAMIMGKCNLQKVVLVYSA